MIPLGGALEASGGTALIAGGLITATDGLPVWVSLTVLMVVTMSLSDVLNNTATAIVAAPVGITMAQSLGVSPDPFLMAVAVAASAAFLTPIGHNNNTLILGPGGYRFRDYWRWACRSRSSSSRLRSQRSSSSGRSEAASPRRVNQLPLPSMNLRVTDLACARGPAQILAGVSFAVAPGQALILRGPNGAGKTTLLRTLAGLTPPLALTMIEADPDAIAYAAHADGLKSQLTVEENLIFWAGVFGTSDPAPAIEAFHLTPLLDRRAGEMSAGQKRRLSLGAPAGHGAARLVPRRADRIAGCRERRPFRRRRDDASATRRQRRDRHPYRPWSASGHHARHHPFRRQAHPHRRPFRGADGMIGLLKRDLTLAIRAGGGFGLSLAFFLIFTTLVPLSVGPQTAILSDIAPGILWLGALLACLLSLDRIFQLDWEDGTLDLIATSPVPLEGLAAMKALAHWMTTGLPLVVAAPRWGVLAEPACGRGIVWLMASLALGTPALSAIGAFGAALTVGVKRGGLLLSLLVLPLYVPTLIFGALTVARGATGQDALTPLILVGGSRWAVSRFCPSPPQPPSASICARGARL